MSIPRSFPSLYRLVALASVLLPATAQAALFCVSTSAALQSALDTAASNQQDNLIRVVIGTYVPPSAIGFAGGAFSSHHLEIRGGYLPTCLIRLPSQRSTIDGQNQRSGMQLSAAGGVNARFTVRHLAFVDGRSTAGNLAGGLSVLGLLNSQVRWTIENNLFSGNQAVAAGNANAGALRALGHTDVRLAGNVFIDNLALDNYGAAEVSCSTGFGGLVNNTFVGNGGPGIAVGGVRVGGSCTWSVANNIFWGNDGIDYQNGSSQANLRYNAIEDYGQTVAPAQNVGTVQIDPEFTDASLPMLKRSSPLVDYGENAPFGGLPALSFDGGPRLVGAAVDLGAFELDILFLGDFQ